MNNWRKKTKSLYTTVFFLGGAVVVLILLLHLPFTKERELIYDPHKFDATDYISWNGFLYDNSYSIEEILTTEYSLDNLKNFFGSYSSTEAGIIEVEEPKSISWDDVNSSFPIQCLRYHNNVHYTVYRVKEGGLFYVFWMVPLKNTPKEFIDKTCPIKVRFSIYLQQLPSLLRFVFISRNKSTAQDVLRRDPQMELDFFASSGVCSYHLLENGKVLKIRYKSEKWEGLSDLIVDGYEIQQKSCCSAAIAAIAESDLPGNRTGDGTLS